MKKAIIMFALAMGMACAANAQENKKTATAETVTLTKEVYPQVQENSGMYHGLTKRIGFDRMIPPHGLEVAHDKTVHISFPLPCATWTWVLPT